MELLIVFLASIVLSVLFGFITMGIYAINHRVVWGSWDGEDLRFWFVFGSATAFVGGLVGGSLVLAVSAIT